MVMEIEVSSTLVDRLLAEAERAHPHEACGLLLGRGGRIDEARRCRNVHPDSARRFEIDPRSLIEAYRDARSGGPDVLGYYHTHPSGPASPSAIDRAQATGDGKVWAIVGERTVGWWRDTAGGFEALSYRTDDG